MMFVPSIIALFILTLIRQPIPCESLKCYEFSIEHVVDCTGKCLSYLHQDENGTTIHRCCSDRCNVERNQNIYSCMEDRCNGLHSDRKLLVMNKSFPPKRIIRKRADEQLASLVSCYECSAHNPQCGIDETTITRACRACLIFRNIYDNNNILRRCCTSDCGEPDTIGQYEGRTAYFCGSDLCNGIISDDKLPIKQETSTIMTAFSTTVTSSMTTTSTAAQTISQCYDCSGPQCGKEGSPVSTNCPSCMVYRDPNNQSKIERRCCWWACGAPNTVTMYNGFETYFCTGDKCNREGVESMLSPPTMATTTSLLVTTTRPTVSSCYECAGPQCGKGGASVSGNCPSCMLYRNPNDQTRIERRCCWWACGPPNTVGMYNNMETYFCVGDECNGDGAESALSPPITTTTAATLSSTVTMSTTTRQTAFQCHQCSGVNCGKDSSTMSGSCPSCMAYRNPNDQTIIERRCCWTNCGPSNSIKIYEGVETYFCTGDGCNKYGVEFALSPPVTTTTRRTTATLSSATTTRTTLTTTQTTTVTLSSTVTTSTTTRQTAFQCHQCSGVNCGKDSSTISGNCPSCMAYRNPNDQTIIERRCCWTNCGPSNSIKIYEGVETYFCTGDGCNKYGVEFALSPPVTTTTRRTTATLSSATTTRTTLTTTQMTTVTLSSTVTTSTTTRQTAFQCHQCSGVNCGKDSSTISGNCPSCMAYRNPNDQTIIERRCCWTNCGPSNSVKIYEGVETYFCTGDGCNKYGVEFALSPPVTTRTTASITTTTATTTRSTATMTTTVTTTRTTTATTTTTTSTTTISVTTTNVMTTSTSSAGTCVLNCQNGGTAETVDGCFCYCLDNTYGRECENIDCAQPDVDASICTFENQPLCEESENFAFECHHLCGKC